MEQDTVQQLEKSLKSSNFNNTPDTSAPHAERYIFYDHSDCRKESFMWYLEMQGLQNYFCWRSLRIRYQRRHYCQSYNEQIEKAKGISSSTKIIVTTKNSKEIKEDQTTMISVYLNYPFILFFCITNFINVQ